MTRKLAFIERCTIDICHRRSVERYASYLVNKFYDLQRKSLPVIRPSERPIYVHPVISPSIRPMNPYVQRGYVKAQSVECFGDDFQKAELVTEPIEERGCCLLSGEKAGMGVDGSEHESLP